MFSSVARLPIALKSVLSCDDDCQTIFYSTSSCSLPTADDWVKITRSTLTQADGWDSKCCSSSLSSLHQFNIKENNLVCSNAAQRKKHTHTREEKQSSTVPVQLPQTLPPYLLHLPSSPPPSSRRSRARLTTSDRMRWISFRRIRSFLYYIMTLWKLLLSTTSVF